MKEKNEARTFPKLGAGIELIFLGTLLGLHTAVGIDSLQKQAAQPMQTWEADLLANRIQRVLLPGAITDSSISVALIVGGSQLVIEKALERKPRKAE